MRFLLSLLLFGLLITGCTNAAPAPTPTPIVEVVMITATPLPATPTLPPTETAVPEPSRTPRPSQTPTPMSSTADGGSSNPTISRDGRYIVFESEAGNISPNTPIRDCRSEVDGRVRPCRFIYSYDRETDELILVSAKFNGLPADGNSYLPVISDDGRYIAYMSGAGNLESEEINCDLDGQWFRCPNVFVYDRTTRQTRWVSRPLSDEYPTGVLNISPSSLNPTISGDGRFIAYMSRATNLVENDDNRMTDIFVFDQESGTNRVVSLSSTGELGNGPSLRPAISQDGRIVVFASYSNNLVADDTNNAVDIFAHDLESGETTRVSVASDGTEGDNFSDSPSISDDGRYVLFESFASTLDPNDLNFVCDVDFDGREEENCLDVFLHDRELGTTTLVSLSANGGQNFDMSYSGGINGDGTIAIFANAGSGLVAGDGNDAYDIFLRELGGGTTTRISLASDGSEGDHHSGITNDPMLIRSAYSISADGRYIVFGSSATNFTDSDFNFHDECDRSLDPSRFELSCSDIFLHDRETGETILISYPRKVR